MSQQVLYVASTLMALTTSDLIIARRPLVESCYKYMLQSVSH